MDYDFPYIGNFIIPTDELHHFSEGLKPLTRHGWMDGWMDGWIDVFTPRLESIFHTMGILHKGSVRNI